MAGKSQYTPKVLEQLNQYLDGFESHGDVIPTVEGFSDVIGRCKKTVYNWSQKPGNEAFLHAFKRLKTKQHRVLLNKGLSNQINPMLTKLMLINNHGYTEKKEVKNEGSPQTVVLQTHFPTSSELDHLSDEALEEIARRGCYTKPIEENKK